MSYVYILVEPQSKKFYIGSCDDFEKRLTRHFDQLHRNVHHNVHMQELHNSGKNFVFIFRKYKSRKLAYKEEDRLIKKNKDNPLMLNIGLGTRGGDNLSLNPNRKTIIQKMTKSIIKRFSEMTPEERKAKHGKIGKANGMFGRKHSEESRKKISEGLTGLPGWNKGIPMTPEHKEKFMNYIKNRDISGKSNPFFGKVHSDETKKKIVETRRKMLVEKFNRGEDLGRVRPVVIHGKVFITAEDAAKEHGVYSSTVHYRVNSKLDTWKEWQYYKRPESTESTPTEETV